jgi:hypothetical protein
MKYELVLSSDQVIEIKKQNIDVEYLDNKPTLSGGFLSLLQSKIQ